MVSSISIICDSPEFREIFYPCTVIDSGILPEGKRHGNLKTDRISRRPGAPVPEGRLGGCQTYRIRRKDARTASAIGDAGTGRTGQNGNPTPRPTPGDPASICSWRPPDSPDRPDPGPRGSPCTPHKATAGRSGGR